MLGSAFNRRQLADALADRACARNFSLHGFRDEITFDIDSYAMEATERGTPEVWDPTPTTLQEAQRSRVDA